MDGHCSRQRNMLAIFVTALVTLATELILIRVFDVILFRVFAYIIITCAMFAFGAAGVFLAIFNPAPDQPSTQRRLLVYAVTAALLLAFVRPAVNLSGLNLAEAAQHPITVFGQMLFIYGVLVLTFFFLGLIIVEIISLQVRHIHATYFSDLVGAGIGCIVFLPFLARIGPGGLLLGAAGLMLGVAALFVGGRAVRGVLLAGAAAGLALPFALDPDRLDFRMLVDKRDVSEGIAAGRREVSIWDVIAKLDVIDVGYKQVGDQPCCWKHLAYDGGNQSTRLFRLDDDPAGLRRRLDDGTVAIRDHFWFGGVVAAHYLRRDRQQDVLIIGSGGGQEVTAALAYGAGRVDAVEMVGTVIDLVRTTYADYIGDVFNDARVQVIHGEGRSYLRSTAKTYDVIQIFSNFTSSAAAEGGANSNSFFLQTADAYQEYFRHLKADGILQVNVFDYPRVVATAAMAWRALGRQGDFQDHVAILERTYVNDPNSGRYQMLGDTLPTILIKMTPWTPAEVAELVDSQTAFEGTALPVQLVVNPVDRQGSFLSRDFFSGHLPDELAARLPYDVRPATDDWPFFAFIRKPFYSSQKIEPDPRLFVNLSTAKFMNGQIQRGVSVGLFQFIIPGAAALAFAVLFIIVPMLFAPSGRIAWRDKAPLIVYFACLGFGFIVIELMAIQIFAKLIGFPLYIYSTVIFTMLLAAGLGSMVSGRLGIGPDRRWPWPFVGIALGGAVLLHLYPVVLDTALAWPLPARIATAMLLLFPLSFCLGMPFPLGILAVRTLPAGAVAWAWALNAVFTVAGGFASIVASLLVGFRATLLGALATYAIALAAFALLRRAGTRGA